MKAFLTYNSPIEAYNCVIFGIVIDVCNCQHSQFQNIFITVKMNVMPLSFPCLPPLPIPLPLEATFNLRPVCVVSPILDFHVDGSHSMWSHGTWSFVTVTFHIA